MNTLQKITLFCILFLTSISWAAEKNWIRLDVEKPINSATVALSSNGLKIALADKSPGFIYTSSDAGITWTEQKGSGLKNWSAIAFSGDGKLLIAANQNGFIYTSSDAGITWTEQKGSGQRNWSSIASSDTGTRLVATELNGYIYTSSDKGVTWIERTESGQRTWRGIALSSNGSKIAAVAQNGYIYTSSDYGVNWSERTGSGKRSWYSVASSADGNKLAAADFSGYIYGSINGGGTWSARSSMQRGDWVSVASSADGNKLVAVQDNGLVYISTNGGYAWTELELSMTRRWTSVASSSDGSMLVGTVIGGGAYALTAPLILNITSSKPDGTYKVGDIIPLDITFSEPMTSTGVTVTLETGTTDRACSFTLINSVTGVCNYKVQAGDITSALTVNSIKGTIRDVAGRALTNFVPLKNLTENKKITIDTSSSGTTTTTPTIPGGPVCDASGLYRLCPLSKTLENSTQYRENMVCEGFISADDSRNKRIFRIEVLNIAVNMLHSEKTPAAAYKNTYTDITPEGNSEETLSVIQTGLDNNLIFANNGAFEPTKKISRIEAYALLMRGVCMSPVEGEEDMARAIHQKAIQEGITVKQWARFRPYSTITRNEVFILASALADWADKHGGCERLECRK